MAFNRDHGLPGPGTPMDASEPTAPSTRDPSSRLVRFGALAVALVVVLVALVAPGRLVTIPFGGLAVNILLVLGLLSLFLILFEHRSRKLCDPLFVAVVPFLAAGILTRLLYMDPGTSQAVVLTASGLPEVLSAAAGLLVAWGALRLDPSRPKRALYATAAIGTLALAAVAGIHLRRAWPLPEGGGAVVASTLVLVAAALALQRWLAHGHADPRIAALAGGAGLAVAGGQLLDGVVSYMAVVDPFQLSPGQAVEEVPLSRWLLSTSLPIFPVIKWGLGAVVVALVAGSADAKPEEPWWPHFAVLMLVLFVGLGPGLFSTLQVLGG